MFHTQEELDLLFRLATSDDQDKTPNNVSAREERDGTRVLFVGDFENLLEKLYEKAPSQPWHEVPGEDWAKYL